MELTNISVSQLSSHQELWTFIVTNLASVYIREGNRHQEVRGHRGPRSGSQGLTVCYGLRKVT